MANFTTHIAVGTVASGLMATMVMAANIVTPEHVLTLAAAGTLGSVLPDVDLKDSRPSQTMFSLLGVFIAFAVLFNVGWRYSIAEMWVLWAATFLGVRYVGGWIFHRLSYHRGIYHSFLAGAFFAFLTAGVYRHILGANETVSWLGGIFMFVGYLVHLTLDEIYSVDVMDVRVKSSFGTALKLYDTKHLGHSAAMAVATVLAFLITPPFLPSWKAIAQPEILAGLQDRLLPKQTWFGIDPSNIKVPAGLRKLTAGQTPAEEKPGLSVAPSDVPAETSASPITTGTIARPDSATDTSSPPQGGAAPARVTEEPPKPVPVR